MSLSATRKLVVLAAVVAVSTTSLQGYAQDRQSATNAALQARQRMMNNMRNRGYVGRGYRPYSAWSYQNSASTHTQALYAYGERCEQVQPAVAREHLAEIRRNLDLLQAELDKFGEEAAKQAEVEERIATIREHYTAAAATCEMLEEAIGEEKVEQKPLCAHCLGLKNQLDAADAEFHQLMEDLGIELPGAEGEAADSAQQSEEPSPKRE